MWHPIGAINSQLVVLLATTVVAGTPMRPSLDPTPTMPYEECRCCYDQPDGGDGMPSHQFGRPEDCMNFSPAGSDGSSLQLDFRAAGVAALPILRPVAFHSEAPSHVFTAPVSGLSWLLRRVSSQFTCNGDGEGHGDCHTSEYDGTCDSLISGHQACSQPSLQPSDVDRIAALLADGLTASDWPSLGEYGPAIRVTMGAPYLDVVACNSRVLARFPIVASSAASAQ